MADEEFSVTKKGLDELLKEQDSLIHVVRDEAIRELQEAHTQGDLSENADYDAVRDRQACVEAKIHDLEVMIANAEIISGGKKAATRKTVSLSSTVTILGMSTDEEETYNIVGSIEADPLNGKLFSITPLMTSLMNHKIGDVVEIGTIGEPHQVKVIDSEWRKRAEKILFFFQGLSC